MRVFERVRVGLTSMEASMTSAADRGIDRGLEGVRDMAGGVRNRDVNRFLRGVKNFGGGFIDSMNPCMLKVVARDLRDITPRVRIGMGKRMSIRWEKDKVD